MKHSCYTFWVIILMLLGCGDPSEQQANREKLMEGLKDHQVKRVTEEQVLAAAYQEGSRIVEQLLLISDDFHYWIAEGLQVLDSLNVALNHQQFKLVTPETPAAVLTQHETALFEAYQFSAEQDQTLSNNVQNSGDQSLLYTQPFTKEDTLVGMWSLMLSRKTLVRDL